MFHEKVSGSSECRKNNFQFIKLGGPAKISIVFICMRNIYKCHLTQLEHPTRAIGRVKVQVQHIVMSKFNLIFSVSLVKLLVKANMKTSIMHIHGGNGSSECSICGKKFARKYNPHSKPENLN